MPVRFEVDAGEIVSAYKTGLISREEARAILGVEQPKAKAALPPPPNPFEAPSRDKGIRSSDIQKAPAKAPTK